MPRMNAPQDLANQLRDAINSSGMTRQALADKADVSKQVLDKFMTIPGKTITLETAEKIGRALGMKSLRL